jgi:hypothetical protein
MRNTKFCYSGKKQSSLILQQLLYRVNIEPSTVDNNDDNLNYFICKITIISYSVFTDRPKEMNCKYVLASQKEMQIYFFPDKYKLRAIIIIIIIIIIESCGIKRYNRQGNCK